MDAFTHLVTLATGCVEPAVCFSASLAEKETFSRFMLSVQLIPDIKNKMGQTHLNNTVIP